MVGVHWGFFHQNVSLPYWVDFTLSSPNTVHYRSLGNARHIPISSANFTPEVFSPDFQIKKYWDVLCVAKADKKKNLDKFLCSVRAYFDTYGKIRVC